MDASVIGYLEDEHSKISWDMYFCSKDLSDAGMLVATLGDVWNTAISLRNATGAKMYFLPLENDILDPIFWASSDLKKSGSKMSLFPLWK